MDLFRKIQEIMAANYQPPTQKFQANPQRATIAEAASEIPSPSHARAKIIRAKSARILLGPGDPRRLIH
jgi:hypothetical protein